MSNKPSEGSNSDSLLTEFKQLFKSVWKEHVCTQHSLVPNGEATQAALKFAKRHNLHWGVELIEASRETYSPRNSDHVARLNLLRVPASVEGIKLSLLGKAYAIAKDFDEAIRHYKRALELPGYEFVGFGLIGLGSAYYLIEAYDDAMRCYEMALVTPGFDLLGVTRNLIGNVHHARGMSDEAIQFYKAALATPDYDRPGDALNNLGNEYHRNRDYDQAISYYKAAIEAPGFDTPHLAKINLASTLEEKGDLSEARSILEGVLKEPDSENRHWRAESVLRIVKQKLDQIKPSPEEIALSQKPDTNDPYALNMLKELSGKTTQYDQYIKEYKSKGHDKKSDELLILRGWSSSVTLLEGATNRHWYGGGYFLRWRGKGLIIDPGFDFIDNFHEAGCHLLEVSAVVVSHDHTDHNGDLRSLDDLIYELSRSPEIKADGISFKPVIIVDEDTSRRISDGVKDHRGPIRLFTDGDRVDESWYGGKRNRLPFRIQHFPVFHGNDVPRAQGFKILLLDEKDRTMLTIGYTGDTGYSEDLHEYLKDVDVLIAHISQPDALELQDPSHFKKVHLGYNGVTELVKHLKPKLTLVGEFWAGLVDLRMDIIAGVRRRTGVKTVLPATLGLRLSLPDLSVTCTSTGKQTPYDQVRVVPPTEPFGDLGYVHPDRLI